MSSRYTYMNVTNSLTHILLLSISITHTLYVFLLHTQNEINPSVCLLCSCTLNSMLLNVCVLTLCVCVSGPSAIPQFSGALRLINSSGAVGDVGVGAAYSYHYRLN